MSSPAPAPGPLPVAWRASASAALAAVTVIALVRIGLRTMQRSPYAWFVMFFDMAVAGIVLALVLLALAAIGPPWRQGPWLYVALAASVVGSVPALAIAVFGYRF